MEAKLGTVMQTMIFDMHSEGVSLLHIIRSSEIRNVFFVLNKNIGCREDSRTVIFLHSCRMAMSRILKTLLGKENDMAKAERWAMTDASREDVVERLGFDVTDAEWEEICSEVYEDAKDALLDVVEEVADRMECENAPA